jgi:hypothetical protein
MVPVKDVECVCTELTISNQQYSLRKSSTPDKPNKRLTMIASAIPPMFLVLHISIKLKLHHDKDYNRWEKLAIFCLMLKISNAWF